MGKQCRKLDIDHDSLTVCSECNDNSQRCPRKVEFMATMLSRETGRPIQEIIEEWEAELTPSRELYQQVLELRAALALAEHRSWVAQEEAEEHSRMLVRQRDVELEEEKRRVAMLIRYSSESNAKVEWLEDKIVDLKDQVGELNEDNDRLYGYLMSWMCPNL